MKRILIGFLTLAAATWMGSFLLQADAADNRTFYWIEQLLVLTGVMAFATMAGVMLLALRLRGIENWLGGLDKSYRLHKYGGISAAILLLFHWLLQQSKHWLIDLGWVSVPGRGPGPHGNGVSLRHLAESVGEWAFYGLLALVVISLLQWISYRRFRLIHKAGGIVFLAGAFHALILLPEGWLGSPAGLLTLAAAIAGGLAAIVSLTGNIGRYHRQTGEILRLHSPDSDVLEVDIQLPAGWRDYRAGQFAFVTFDRSEGPHPFTVLRYQADRRVVTFAIKALGDYTRTLKDNLQSQQQVRVEGPYGRFVPSGKGGHQIWIGAGIGITPFVAWLESLAEQPHPAADVDLYYCVCRRDQAIYEARLRALCERVPGMRLHLLADDEHCRLKAGMLIQETSHPPAIWFCGPAPFARALQAELKRMGVSPRGFHRELFEMR